MTTMLRIFSGITMMILVCATGCSKSPNHSEISSKTTTQSTEAIPPVDNVKAEKADPLKVKLSTNKPEICKITQAIVADMNPPLNVRSSPNVENSRIVGKLKNGTWLSVQQEDQGWLKIIDPISGWVAKNLTETSCNQLQETIYLSSESHPITISNRFIGGGEHQYLLDVNTSAGQAVRITAHGDSPLPFVFAYNDKNRKIDLANHERNKNIKTWRTEISKSNKYFVVFGSNYKGYSYKITISFED